MWGGLTMLVIFLSLVRISSRTRHVLSRVGSTNLGRMSPSVFRLNEPIEETFIWLWAFGFKINRPPVICAS